MPRENPYSRRIFPVLAAAGLGAVILLAWLAWRASTGHAARVVAATGPESTQAVSAIGRFAPMEPVTRVTAPYLHGQPPLVTKVVVTDGEPVRTGQLIAVLDGREQLQAAVREAQARVTERQIRLQQVQEEPRPSDVAAHAAEVERWQESARTAEADFERYRSLRKTHDVSASDTDAKRDQMVYAQQMLEAAKARQAALTEHHAQDVEAAQAALDEARAQLERARSDAAAAEVLAPADGVILNVRARAGEQVGADGIVELARTAQMDVLAEVYETDIQRVRMGEHAQVTSDLLPAGTKLSGSVVEIGREVGRTDMPSSDPAAYADARVVQVRIRLADGAAAAKLIGGKATVVLQP